MWSSFPKCHCGKYTEQNRENVCFSSSNKISGCVQMGAIVFPFFWGGCWFCRRLQRLVSQCCKDTLNNCIGIFFFPSQTLRLNLFLWESKRVSADSLKQPLTEIPMFVLPTSWHDPDHPLPTPKDSLTGLEADRMLWCIRLPFVFLLLFPQHCKLA